MNAPTMQVPGLPRLVEAETRRLLSRLSVRVALGAMAAIGVALPLLMLLITLTVKQDVDGEVNRATFELSSALYSTLAVRNFFVFRAMLIAVVAVSVAGELGARTLREDLLRPVPRGRALMARWLALMIFVAAGLVLPATLALVLGVPMFGFGGDLRGVAELYGLTFLGDAGFGTMVLAIALFSRSVPGTIGGVFLYWVFDQMLQWLLWVLSLGLPLVEGTLKQQGLEQLFVILNALVQARPWLPSAAFNLYWDHANQAAMAGATPWYWQSYVALVLITGLSMAAAHWRFRTMDID